MHAFNTHFNFHNAPFSIYKVPSYSHIPLYFLILCAQLLNNATLPVVRERLKTAETPYMLTALADLTRDVSYYERAWVVSNKRYARAKRSLAQHYYDKQEYAACIEHMNEALLVQPLVASAWYLKGIACMHLERW